MLINMSYDFDHFIHETFEGEPPLGVNFPSGSRSVFSYFVDMQVHFPFFQLSLCWLPDVSDMTTKQLLHF